MNAPQFIPDVIVKIALDPSPKFHIEVGGVERQFRIAVNNAALGATAATAATALATPSVNRRLTGGGAFLNLNFQLFPGFRVLTNNFWSNGGGRYIFGQNPTSF